MWFDITSPTMPPTATPIGIIKIVVWSIALGALLGLLTLGLCMTFGLKAETGLLTAFVGLTGQLIGSLTGLLGNTRTQPPPDTNGRKYDFTPTQPQ